MSAFIRLQDGDATDIERLLLESGAEDEPSQGARARTLLAIGAGASAAMATPGAVHAAASAAAVAGSGSAKATGSMTALVLAKWLGTGAMLGAVTAACIATATTPGLLVGTNRSERAASVAVPAAPRSVPHSTTPALGPADDTRPAAEGPGAPAPEARVAVSPPASAPGRSVAITEKVPTPVGPAAGASQVPAPWVSGSSVLAEVASLDRARAALGSGDARTALARLAEHHQHFSGGALEPEAVVLEVRALVQLGRRSEATALVNRFLAAHPNSSQGARLRTLVGSAPR